MRGRLQDWWWLPLGAVVLVVAFAVDRSGEGTAPPEAVHAAVLCASQVEASSVPAVASEDVRRERVEVLARPADPRCSGLDGPPGAGALQVHDEAPGAAGGITVSGRLQVGDDGSCFYLDATGGPFAIVWPRGSGAAFDPPRVTGPGGTTLAPGGASIVAEGRYVDGAAHACGPVPDGGTAFLAGRVRIR